MHDNATASDPVLSVEGLTVSLPPGGDRPNAVEALSLAVRAGEIVCVVGESGSGKSVAAQALMGLLPAGLRAEAGRAAFGGRDLLKLDATARSRVNGAEIGMVFQEPSAALNPVFRIGALFDETLRLHTGLKPSERRARALALLDEVQLPEPAAMLRAYPHQLSGGQAQRAMIALALALGPRLLIADEPTTALDVTTQARILSLIDGVRRSRGAGVLFITHDFGVVVDIADRVVVMEKGRIVETGTVDQVLQAPVHPYTRALIAAVPRGVPAAPRPAAGAPILVAAELRKTYGARGSLFARAAAAPALDGVDLALHPGETLGVVGESGSGKSTLARLLMRLETADAGRVDFAGVDLLRLKGRALRAARARIQMVFQDPYSALNPRQRIGAAIAEGPIIHGAAPEAAGARARSLLDAVGLPPQAADRFPHEFSGGQRQRICIARALALEPQVLIADEAVSALDVSVQAQIVALLRRMQDEHAFALMFITHDLRLAAELCDRIVVMHRGRIVEEGATAAVFAAPRHGYTRSLLDAVPGKRLIRAAAQA